VSRPIFEPSTSRIQVYSVNSKFGKIYDHPGNKGNGDDVIPEYYVVVPDPYCNVCARIFVCRINFPTAWLAKALSLSVRARPNKGLDTNMGQCITAICLTRHLSPDSLKIQTYIQRKKRVIFLFLCGLFNDFVSCSDYSVIRLVVTNELERVWNKAVMA
jgi:hypothetical protein